MTHPELAESADAAFAPVIARFRLARTAEERTRDWEIVVYQNEVAAIRLYRELRRDGLLVQLFRLRDHRPPLRWGVDERARDRDNGFDVIDLVRFRAPTQATADEVKALSTAQLSDALARYADWLSRYAADVLAGDFAVFEQLASIVESRRRTRSASR